MKIQFKTRIYNFRKNGFDCFYRSLLSSLSNGEPSMLSFVGVPLKKNLSDIGFDLDLVRLPIDLKLFTDNVIAASVKGIYDFYENEVEPNL